MYEVSELYKSSMDSQIRGTTVPKVQIMTVDAPLQSKITEEYIDGNTSFSVFSSKVSRIDGAVRTDIATLEPDTMTGNGSYKFYDNTDPHYYISSSVSNATPDANLEYPLTVPLRVRFDFNNGQWENGERPITLIFGGQEKRVEVTLWYNFSVEGMTSFTKEYIVSNGKLILDDLPQNTYRYRDITIRVLTMSAPRTRARIKYMFLGTEEKFTSSEMISLNYSDVCDGIGEELPSRTISIGINNLNGRFVSEIEYSNPTLVKYNTQATAYLECSVGDEALEIIPLGRFFLEDYTITREVANLNFVSAVEALNNGIHEWSTITAANLETKLQEVINPVIPNIAKETSEAKKYNISLDLTQARNLSAQVINACPPIPSAQALQLYGNLSGNVLRHKRCDGETEVCHILLPENRHISLGQLTKYPEWNATPRIGKIICMISELKGEKIDKEVLVDNTTMSGSFMSKFTSDNPMSFAGGYEVETLYDPITDEFKEILYLTSHTLALFAHSVYLQGSGGPWYDARICADTQKITTTAKVFALSEKDGIDYKITNPLLSDSGGFSASEYAQRVYDELKYNLIATLSSRGYPEIDAGDIITIETEEYPQVLARVVENNITLSGGAMSGTTKVRRLA